MGRNVLRGPGYWQLSPAIYKNFKIKEKVNAEFRAESTNFTNTPIWGNPNAGASASLRRNRGRLAEHGRRRSVCRTSCRITGATAGRQFRFGLRVAF